MSLLLEEAELTSLMRDFYVLTGIRLVLFDEGGNKIIAYPPGKETFCSCMRKNPEFEEKCCQSDKWAFEKCNETRELVLYKCHGGLLEAVAPIVQKKRVIGYMMLGQITDIKDKEQLYAQMNALCFEYGIQGDLEGVIGKIKYKNTAQIKAAAKILAACTEYVRLKEMVKPMGRKIIDALNVYVEEHMRENIDVERICSHFHIGRTKLYEALHPYLGGGVAAFVKQKRLEKAKELLENTDMTVAEVADAVGFSDYNYFLRTFKQQYGVSFGKMRKMAQGEKK